MQTPVDKAVKAFGSAYAVAAAINIAPSALCAWRKRGGYIPTHQQRKLLNAARAKNVLLTADDVIHCE